VDVAPLTAAKIVGNDWCHQVQQSRATSEALAGADLTFAGALVLAFHTSSDESARTALSLSPGPHAGAVSPCVEVLARGAGSRDLRGIR
jgi:pyrimidine deaminase RibD-like protein